MYANTVFIQVSLCHLVLKLARGCREGSTFSTPCARQCLIVHLFFLQIFKLTYKGKGVQKIEYRRTRVTREKKTPILILHFKREKKKPEVYFRIFNFQVLHFSTGFYIYMFILKTSGKANVKSSLVKKQYILDHLLCIFSVLKCIDRYLCEQLKFSKC